MDFFSGFLVGAAFQMAVGPVTITVLHKSITQGFRKTLPTVLGVVLVDLLYLVLSVLGVSFLLQAPAIKKTVALVGSAVLALFGLKTFFSPVRSIIEKNGGRGLMTNFLHGVGVTLADPLTIIVWSGVMAGFIGKSQPSTFAIALFILGVVLSTFVFQTTYAFLGNKHLSRFFRSGGIKWLNRLAGIIIMALAVKLGLSGFH